MRDLSFIIFMCMVFECQCFARPVSSHYTVKSPAPSTKKAPPAPSPPAAPSCQGVGDMVSANILRDRLCADACFVVVNAGSNTSEMCADWSPYSFWDGKNCVGRCELLGGNSSALECTLGGVTIPKYSKSTPGMQMYLAPIRCGAWLGVRDSASNASWFASGCFSILENRLATEPANVSECGPDKRTVGCRFLDTNQSWVPACRGSGLNECGVEVQCPDRNPCKLSADIDTILRSNFSTCKTQTHLALNVSADETNCYSWTEFAFLLDGYCVSSCGRMDNQCVLGGVEVPPCVTQRNGSISPGVCAVPMPSDRFAGFRNGFYGKSRVKNSQCLVTRNCTSWGPLCFHIEGMFVTPLEYSLSSSIPVCVGDSSTICKIELPCFVDEPPVKCDAAIGISQSIYKRFNVYNCEWFKWRDGVMVACWVVFGLLGCIALAALEDNPWTFLLCWCCCFCAVVWEFAIGPILFGVVLYRLNHMTSEYSKVPSQASDSGGSVHSIAVPIQLEEIAPRDLRNKP
jgi:hypothetical protein